ncbi:hypothetical protein E8P77_09430 [Soehngenia saccharolytica]|nr:hypothetical protein E8P77_09430 [Soehngenia saccharolytica]
MPKDNLVSRVINQIGYKLDTNQTGSSSKNILIAINGTDSSLDKKLSNIYAQFSKEYNFIIAYSFTASQILDIESINQILKAKYIFTEDSLFDLDHNLQLFDTLICPNITINTLSKVVSGNIDTYISNLIWASLYFDKTTYIDFENCKKFMSFETKNKTMKNQIDQKIREIMSMGAVEIVYPLYDFKIKGTRRYDSEFKSKIVITDRDVDAINVGEELHLPYGSIITPLAKDKIRDRNIKIVIDMEAKK